MLHEALAVHLGFVPEPAADALFEARPPLSDEARRVIDAVARGLLERHGGDLSRCLAGLKNFGRVLETLERDRRAGSHPTLGLPINRLLQTEGDEHSSRDQWGESSAGDSRDESPGLLGLSTSTGMRFQLLRAHAQGGIGQVFVAYDSELQREVALKQIKPERADDADSRARFLLEAEVTGRLEHPGVVPVYGLGVDHRGRPFYAMRFVRGMSLEQAIKDYHESQADPGARALELRRLLTRFVDVCQTIAYAHSRGVLHRDLKPANILLGPFNESLVVDWGLAKIYGKSSRGRTTTDRVRGAMAGTSAGHETGRKVERLSCAAAGETASIPAATTADDMTECSTSEPKLLPAQPSGPEHAPDEPSDRGEMGFTSSTETAAGTAFGTPAFMSPEQAEGRHDQLRPTTDVYSLGAVLYTLLCGKAPFEYLWCDVTALLEKVKIGEFPSPRQIKPGVPRALEDVCLKAMARRPEDRYASAALLAEDVERFLGDEPVAAFAEPWWMKALRFGRRHKPVVAGLAALLLTTVVGLAVGIVLLDRERQATEAQSREAQVQRRIAVGKSMELNQKAEVLSRRDYTSRVNLAAREFLDDNVGLADALLENCPRDLRGWEWNYAYRLGHAELASWPGASNGYDVWCLAFSPDGKWLASGAGPWFQPGGAATAELVVRELPAGGELLAWRGEAGAVQCVAFAPDGKRLAYGRGQQGAADQGTIAVLEIPSGRLIWSSRSPGVHILCLAYAPDGRTLAVGRGHFNNYDRAGSVMLHDSETGQPQGPPIPGPPGGVLSMAYTPDSRQLLVTGRDAVHIHDLTNSSHPIVGRLEGHDGFVYAVACSSQGDQIATGGWDRTIRLWDRATGREVDRLLGHRGFVRGLAYSPDGNWLVSCSEDKSIRRWDLTHAHAPSVYHGHTGFVHAVAYAPDGSSFVSGGLDGIVKAHAAASPLPDPIFRNGSGWVGKAVFAPDGTTAATIHDGEFRIWDTRTGEELVRRPATRGLVGETTLVFSHDGRILAAGAGGGEITLWKTDSWTPLRTLRDGTETARDSAFSSDDSRLVSGSGDGCLRFWDLKTGRLLRKVQAHTGPIHAVAISNDDQQIATAGHDRQSRIWDWSGKLLARFEGHKTGARDIAFAPDGSWAVSCGGAYRGPNAVELFLWNPRTGERIRRLEGHTSMVTAVAFFPDGRRLVSASDDRTIKIWDAAHGEELYTLRGHTSGILCLDISRDGTQIVSGGIDYTARIWGITRVQGPKAFALAARREAVARVQDLFERLQLKQEVQAALEHDLADRPAQLALARPIAQRRTENSARLRETAWSIINRPRADRDAARHAVRLLAAAHRVVHNDPGRASDDLDALALAQYRAGLDLDALQTLKQLESLDQNPPGPLVLAVTACACSRLNRTRPALDALRKLEELAALPRYAQDPTCQNLLQEARYAVNSMKSVP